MKNALIIGASGGIGSALYDYYLTQKNYELVKSLSRSNDGFDINFLNQIVHSVLQNSNVNKAMGLMVYMDWFLKMFQ